MGRSNQSGGSPNQTLLAISACFIVSKSTGAVLSYFNFRPATGVEARIEETTRPAFSKSPRPRYSIHTRIMKLSQVWNPAHSAY
jgi:hypothetical protein